MLIEGVTRSYGRNQFIRALKGGLVVLKLQRKGGGGGGGGGAFAWIIT